MLTSSIRVALNRVLNPIGLQIGTTRLDRAEQARLEHIEAQGHWDQPRYGAGIPFDPPGYLDFLQQVCLPYRADYERLPRVISDAVKGYYLHNDYCGPIDAEVWYSILRHFQPSQVVEVGSGFSSRLARLAIEAGGLKTRLTCIDPQPRVDIAQIADKHLAKRVEDMPAEQLAQLLGPGDVLFIDSSHEVKTGGDVNFLLFEVLPRLAAGTWVHIHDIFLPFEYPRSWVIENRWGWNEQYLVHALLMDNSALEIVWPAYFMWHYHRDSLKSVIPSTVDHRMPTSLWLRKTR